MAEVAECRKCGFWMPLLEWRAMWFQPVCPRCETPIGRPDDLPPVERPSRAEDERG